MTSFVCAISDACSALRGPSKKTNRSDCFANSFLLSAVRDSLVWLGRLKAKNIIGDKDIKPLGNKYCVSHIYPIFNLTKNFRLISPDDKSFLCVKDDHFGAEYSGEFLSEYTQLFALAEYLKTENDEFVHLFQYRKFVSDAPNLRSSNVNHYKTCKPDEVDSIINFYEDKILTTNVIPYKNTAANYAQVHIIEDFICLTLAMKEFGFSNKEVKRFINLKYLLAASSLGSYPRKFFIEAMDTLKKVWHIFYNSYYEERQGYQRRVGGFLLERLHSFLLVDYLATTNIPYVHGHIVVVTDDGIVKVTT